MNDNGPRPIEAVRALRARGIDNAEELIAYGTPDQILTACYRWDKRTGVGPGLLARWVRNRQFTEPEPEPPVPQSKGAAMRDRFAEYVDYYPLGSIAEPHARLIARRWPDEPDICPGNMLVVAATFPVLEMECDQCGFIAALPVRALHVLDPFPH